MAVTTRNVFKNQVRKHIEEILNDEHTTDLKEQLQNTVDSFYNWYSGYEQKRNPNIWDAMHSWFMGLPSAINVEYRHFEISNILKQWIEKSWEFYKETDGQKEQKVYLFLITREFSAMCKLHNVEVFR